MNNDLKTQIEDIYNRIEQVVAMVQTAVKLTEPEVDYIIKTKSKDAKVIEHLLDRLLDYSLHCDEGLQLFKKLLRYYYPINPYVTAEYIDIYIELTEPFEDDSDTVSTQV